MTRQADDLALGAQVTSEPLSGVQTERRGGISLGKIPLRTAEAKALWWESESESHSVVSNSLQPHGLYSPWNFPGPNTGVGSLSLLQGIFPTQSLNPGLPHCRWILYQLSHKGPVEMNSQHMESSGL